MLPAFAVFFKEIDPPVDAEPIEWMLLTSEAVTTVADANVCADWYCRRWIIEEWHKVVKTGCRLEAAQLKSAEGLTAPGGNGLGRGCAGVAAAQSGDPGPATGRAGFDDLRG